MTYNQLLNKARQQNAVRVWELDDDSIHELEEMVANVVYDLYGGEPPLDELAKAIDDMTMSKVTNLDELYRKYDEVMR